jgi:hypothetical protein
MGLMSGRFMLSLSQLRRILDPSVRDEAQQLIWLRPPTPNLMLILTTIKTPLQIPLPLCPRADQLHSVLIDV